jgi:hypothetical protein
MCHPEPGPELDSGSNDFRISLSGQTEMLNRVQHDVFLDFLLFVVSSAFGFLELEIGYSQ